MCQGIVMVHGHRLIGFGLRIIGALIVMNKENYFSELEKISNKCESEKERKKDRIYEDIKLIEDALKSSDEEYVKDVHKRIDGRYQACIKKWVNGLYAYDLQHGMSYHSVSLGSLKENLSVMKPKLEAFADDLNANDEMIDKNKINVEVHNNNILSVSITFQEAKEKIEEMGSLTQEETLDIQKQIDELERISKENITRKKKWEKVKPILAFALDKGADIAIMLWNLSLQKSLLGI